MTMISQNGGGSPLGMPPRLDSKIERVDESSPVDTRSMQETTTLRTVSLVIPAKNEAVNVRWVLQQVPDCVDEIILVDGHSTDATIAMALSCRPDLQVLQQQGEGKGDALRAGFEAACGDLIVMMDADGSMTPDEIPRFLFFLRDGYDFVKGSRFVAGGGSLDLTRVRRIGNRALMQMVNSLYDGGLTDLCYGFCAFQRRYLRHLDLTTSGFEVETQLTISALRAGLRIAEVPSLELPRRHGRSNLRPFGDGIRVLRTILRGHTKGISGSAVQGVRRWMHGAAAT
jgi:glycosyltransferase involved in cell wall biosynthesis